MGPALVMAAPSYDGHESYRPALSRGLHWVFGDAAKYIGLK